jgi:hypothetical protein
MMSQGDISFAASPAPVRQQSATVGALRAARPARLRRFCGCQVAEPARSTSGTLAASGTSGSLVRPVGVDTSRRAVAPVQPGQPGALRPSTSSAGSGTLAGQQNLPPSTSSTSVPAQLRPSASSGSATVAGARPTSVPAAAAPKAAAPTAAASGSATPAVTAARPVAAPTPAAVRSSQSIPAVSADAMTAPTSPHQQKQPAQASLTSRLAATPLKTSQSGTVAAPQQSPPRAAAPATATQRPPAASPSRSTTDPDLAHRRTQSGGGDAACTLRRPRCARVRRLTFGFFMRSSAPANDSRGGERSNGRFPSRRPPRHLQPARGGAATVPDPAGWRAVHQAVRFGCTCVDDPRAQTEINAQLQQFLANQESLSHQISALRRDLMVRRRRHSLPHRRWSRSGSRAALCRLASTEIAPNEDVIVQSASLACPRRAWCS